MKNGQAATEFKRHVRESGMLYRDARVPILKPQTAQSGPTSNDHISTRGTYRSEIQAVMLGHTGAAHIPPKQVRHSQPDMPPLVLSVTQPQAGQGGPKREQRQRAMQINLDP